uniref:Uncharacterized protein n=1 Tax=Cannabis sativa TaxID=3483 RepID=A0A803Q9P8_CANSA
MATGDYSICMLRPLLYSSLGNLGVSSTVMWSIWTIVVHLSLKIVDGQNMAGRGKERWSEVEGSNTAPNWGERDRDR